jgi:hypothetical protein
MGLAFLACVERGPLEAQTILLCRSIRRFAGRFREAPIYTFQPRAGHEVAPRTRATLAELGATLRCELLNCAYADYPIGNKIFACAAAERTLREDVLVFLDSDTIVVDEPREFDLAAGIDVAIRPAYSVGLHSTGPGHPMDCYWRRVYDLFGIEKEWFVETEIGSVTRAYFSAGLIVVRRQAGTFGHWLEDFRRLAESGCLPASGIARADEISLVATLFRTTHKVVLLDGRYNYLLFKREQLTPPWDRAQLEELVHIHYRKTFQEAGFLRNLRTPLNPQSEILAWLEPLLRLPYPE